VHLPAAAGKSCFLCETPCYQKKITPRKTTKKKLIVTLRRSGQVVFPKKEEQKKGTSGFLFGFWVLISN
jgi:hypothetical protein